MDDRAVWPSVVKHRHHVAARIVHSAVVIDDDEARGVNSVDSSTCGHDLNAAAGNGGVPRIVRRGPNDETEGSGDAGDAQAQHRPPRGISPATCRDTRYGATSSFRYHRSYVRSGTHRDPPGTSGRAPTANRFALPDDL